VSWCARQTQPSFGARGGITLVIAACGSPSGAWSDHQSCGGLPNTSTALSPPNAKEFDNA
jgi:hypothetical protein